MQPRIERAISPDRVSFWEDKFPIKKLLQMQRDNPAVFAAQYQNDVEAMKELAPVKQKWIKSYDFAQLQRYGLFYQIAVDPGGLSEREETSAMGISVVGAQSIQGAEFGNVYVLESKNLHVDTWTGAKIVVDFWEQYDQCQVRVEEGALQKVFQDIFDKEAKLRNHPYFPVDGIKTSELKDKITLARGVTHFFTRGQVHIDQNRTAELYNKLEDYPAQGTDDVNALLINLHCLKIGWAKTLERAKPKPQREIKRHSVTGY